MLPTIPQDTSPSRHCYIILLLPWRNYRRFLHKVSRPRRRRIPLCKTKPHASLFLSFCLKSSPPLTKPQLNDLIGFTVALVAVHVTESKSSPQSLSFGWARAQLLGAFFNGAFLLALGLSIALQSIERFLAPQHVQSPKLVLLVGCIGLALNLISAVFLHEHDHAHAHGNGHANSIHIDTQGRNATPTHATHMHMTFTPHTHAPDLGIMGILLHVLGDALNNIGVIASAAIIWCAPSPARFYADPAVSMWIALLILVSAVPLTHSAGTILLQSAPRGICLDHVKHDLESIPGVLSVHELHVWSLDQKKAVASAHVVVRDAHLANFVAVAKVFSECLHAYGIHSATLQPELAEGGEQDDESGESGTTSTARPSVEKCGVQCGVICEEFKCCN